MIPLFKVFMAPEAREEVVKTLFSNQLTQGPKVEEFEDYLKEWCNVRYLNTTNSGTSALHLALQLAGVTKGKKVVGSPLTCSATYEPAVHLGGSVVWADIDPTSGNVDPNSVEDKLKRYPSIRAIMAVHWGGMPCDLQALNFLSKKYSVDVIEDAAHSFGSEYQGQKLGVHSAFTCNSFQAIKLLTTGDGGSLICREEGDHKRAKLLRWFGLSREPSLHPEALRVEQDITEAGYKFHMNDVNATIGIANLPHINDLLVEGRSNASFYDAQLQGLPGITLLSRPSDRKSSFWLYTMLVENRPEFTKFMTDKGIHVSRVHGRNDSFTMYKEIKSKLPKLDYFDARQISIPCHWNVSISDREYIVNSIKEFAETK